MRHVWRTIALFLLAALPWSSCYAERNIPKHVSANCGNAKVDLLVIIPKQDQDGFPPYEKVILSVSNNTGKVVQELYWIETGKEIVNATCFGKNKKYVVYQHNCRGSGCGDGDSLGIIDTENLKILLEPEALNRAKARTILGQEPPYPEIDPGAFFNMRLF
jgi:hypothetical protein